jgi:hypothetical protein
MNNLLSFGFTVCWAYWAQANFIETQVNQPIPDGDLSGLASTINHSGLSDPIGNLRVDLNISGTYNGDLYAYLTHGSGFAVLLSRVGTTATDNLGYGDGGLNVIFVAGGNDIHNYRFAVSEELNDIVAGRRSDERIHWVDANFKSRRGGWRNDCVLALPPSQ